MSESENYHALINEHYKKEAAEHGLSPLSTMPDIEKRQKEIETIVKITEAVIKAHKKKENIRILDLGCGNGFTLKVLREKYPSVILFGVDITKNMVDLVKSRSIENCTIDEGDVCDLFYKKESFDLIYTERCLQNILNWEKQKNALKEVHRVLKKAGYFCMIEGFTDGFENCNKARTELGLDPLNPPYHNLLLDKDAFLNEIKSRFEIVDIPGVTHNFLSSYDFIRLVLHPLVTKGDWIRDTEFVKFFSAVFPQAGNYSRTQAYALKKV